MKTTAYRVLKRFALKYLKENFLMLSEKYGITKEDLTCLIKDENSILEWILGEFLDSNEFKELGIVMLSDWGVEDDDTHTTIYKINSRYVRSSFKCGEYMQNHKFDFVRRVKKKIIQYSYENLS